MTFNILVARPAHPQASAQDSMTPQAPEIFQRPLADIEVGSGLDREYDVAKGMGGKQ